MVAFDLDDNNNTTTSSFTTTTTTTSGGGDGGGVIQLEDEVEGEHQGSEDIFFVNVGQPVPISIKPPGDDDEASHFDPQTLPSHPLAVSERLSLIFLAHSTGFCVARTEDVIQSAKEIEDKGSGSSIQELSVVDVPLGKVNILALSSDSSRLAASIGAHIHFFSVHSLLNKEQKPSFSCSLDNSGCVKDMRWSRKLEDYYVVLSSTGYLYYGAGQEPLKHVMDNVDAVEWSTKGNFVAVARKNILSIMSSKFKQKLSISLSFKSCAGDSDVNCVIKVDSIRWVRSDCIILGCFQLTADGKEESYLVQVITSKNGKITDASSKHIVIYFNDVFEDLSDDIVPSGSGPHLFLSYIGQCELAIAANRKNIGQQLTLFGWSVSDEKNEAAVIDLLGDSWLPRIELQGNGDDNVILGLCVDKVSNSEKVRLKLGEELKELLPCCIVLCLTIEGKLIIFRVASLTGDTVPAEVECTLSDEEEDATAVIPSEHGLTNITSELPEQSVEQEIIKELNRKEADEIPMKNDLKLPEVNESLTNILSAGQVSHKETVSVSQEVRNIVNAQIFETDGQQKVPVVNLNQDTDGRQSLQSGRHSEQLSLRTSHLEGPRATDRDLSKTVNENNSGVVCNTDSFIGKASTDKPGQSILIDSQKGTEVGKESPGSIGSTSLQIAACQSWSSGNLSFSKASDVGSSLSPSGYVQRNETNNSGLSNITSGFPEQSVEQEIIKELNRKEADEIPMKNDPKLPEVNKSLTNILSADQVSRKETVSAIQEVRNIVNAQIFETDGQQKVPVVNLNQDTDGRQSLQSGRHLEQSSLKTSHLEGPRATDRDLSKTVNQKNSGVVFNTDSFIGKVSTDKPGQFILIDSLKGTEVGKESPGSIGSTSLQIAASQSWSSGNFSLSKASDVGSSLSSSSYVQRNETNNSGTSLIVANFSGGPIEKPFYSPAAPSVSVDPSSRLAFGEQNSSTGVRILPEIGTQLPTQGNFVTGKGSNFKFHSNKENSGTPSHTGPLKSEPSLSKESQNVEEMAKELDALLECIVGPGGFRDASTILQESSVVAFEEGIRTLSDKCRKWRSIMDEGLGDIQQLLDKTVQVLARKIYVEGIVMQATDSQYWDLWDRQRLSSELELKRSHVLKVNQDLTNQLIELERHFNTLELNKFGENGEAQLDQRAFLSRYGPSRHVQSLHCLHNTMSSQLATAEQLSQCLSKQMDVLSIESPSTTKKNVKKELFETIGIPYNSASFSSPDPRKDSDTPSNKRLLISSSSAVVKDQSSRNQSSATEQESARRRRDSLDRSLVSFEPPKTTVKRILLQEEHRKRSANRSTFSITKQHLDPHMLEESALAGQKLFTSSSSFLYASENKGIHKPIKQPSETPSHSIQLKSPVMQVLPGNFFPAPSSQFGSNSSPLASQNGAQVSSALTADTSRSRFTINDKSVFEVPLHQKPSVSTSLPSKTDSMPKKSSEMSNTNNREAPGSTSSFGSVKQRPINTVNSIFNSARSESPFTPVPATGPAYGPTAKKFDSDTATSDSQPVDVKFSSSSSLSISSPSPMMNSSSARHFSLLTPSTAPTSSSAMSLGSLSTSSKATTDANQTVLLAKSLTSSSSTLSTRPSFQVHKKLVPSSTPPPSMDLASESTPYPAPQPQVAKSNVEAENSSGKTSSIQPGPPSDTFSLKLADSMPPAPRSEPATNLLFGSNLSFNGMANTGINKVSNPEPGLSFGAPVLSATGLSTSESAVAGGKDGNSQEDEMEEESPETSELTLGNLDGFGIGSTPNPASSKPNPFGGAFANAAATPMSSPPFSMAVPTGELFRPASFNFQSPQASQPSLPANFGAFSGGFSPGNTAQASTGGGFGQPTQIGPGQQALGSVLGTFGQSRQFGAGLGGSSVSSVSGISGGFVNNTGGAFASIGSTSGGFGSLVSAGGGFAGVASAGVGFTAAASAASGFAGSASGSGFPMGGGGFGAFNNQGGSGGFAGFGSGAGGTGRPASELFTQMRK